MERKTQTSLWVLAIALAVTSVLLAQPPRGATATSVTPQPPESQPVTLTLECVDSANIRFQIANTGPTDTALRLGDALANGRKYMINDLNLRMKPPNGNGTDYHYWPRDYPSAIAGRLDQWFQAFPVRAVYSMTAKAEDFFELGRPATFPKGIPLSLRWTISAEEPKSLFPLIYWTGTLISNTCVAP
jgi:hypothetical protein